MGATPAAPGRGGLSQRGGGPCSPLRVCGHPLWPLDLQVPRPSPASPCRLRQVVERRGSCLPLHPYACHFCDPRSLTLALATKSRAEVSPRPESEAVWPHRQGVTQTRAPLRGPRGNIPLFGPRQSLRVLSQDLLAGPVSGSLGARQGGARVPLTQTGTAWGSLWSQPAHPQKRLIMHRKVFPVFKSYGCLSYKSSGGWSGYH